MKILEMVGSTPLVELDFLNLERVKLKAKLEYYNPTGSVKDRAAHFLIAKLLDEGIINKATVLIESSSGNFGVSLSAYSKYHGIKFVCVIDPNITAANKTVMSSHGAELVMISEVDENGGYLLNRIRKVKELRESIQNSYWINQYSSSWNAEAYYHSLGREICAEVSRLDYIFLGVGSGGTITGVSKKLKEVFPNVKVVAVDTQGSVIFGGLPKKRYIPGIGSSLVPEILANAQIDDVVHVDEISTVKMCHELLEKYSIHAGGSSGSVMVAIKKYFSCNRSTRRVKVVAIFADAGWKYLDTIYNKDWVANCLPEFDAN